MSAPVQVTPLTSGRPARCPDWDGMLSEIGARIRAERTSRRWSLTDLSQRAGISKPTIVRMEAGSVHLFPLLKVCWAFRIPVAYLLSGQWKAPERKPKLALRQVEVLREAASGDSLVEVGARLGMDSRAVGAALSRAYVRLGVAELPRPERRAAAVRVAMQYGLFNPPANRTS